MGMGRYGQFRGELSAYLACAVVSQGSVSACGAMGRISTPDNQSLHTPALLSLALYTPRSLRRILAAIRYAPLRAAARPLRGRRQRAPGEHPGQVRAILAGGIGVGVEVQPIGGMRRGGG